MISISATFNGDEWQKFIVQLLYMRYGTNLIEVPDQHKGDSGIEAFSLDGSAFQCYAPEGPDSIPELASKHKKKIYRDIKKFHENKADLKKIFGTTSINRWVLVVPDHCSSDVVKYCQEKTEEVRKHAASVPYATSDFQVLAVNGHSFFASEVAELTRAGGLLVEADIAPVPLDYMKSFSEKHNEWIAKLQEKLLKLHLDALEQAQLEQKLLQAHLEGGNAISYYENKYPVIADRIRSIKQARAKALEIDSKIQSLTIASTRDKFESELASSVPALGRQTAMVLSYASVAEWLMVCPLDPKG